MYLFYHSPPDKARGGFHLPRKGGDKLGKEGPTGVFLKKQLDCIFTDIYPDAVKIGMTAPSKAGKTSLMTAIFYEMKTRLAGNPQGIQYWADSKATQNAISRAIAYESRRQIEVL